MIYNYKCSQGYVTESFFLKMKPGAVFHHEWRDLSRQDRPGPSITVDSDGNLKANGKSLQKVPLDKWVRFEIGCRLGAKASGDYQLKVQVKDEDKAATYRGLRYHPEFYKLLALFFIADGTGPGAFYIDDLSVRSKK